MDEFPRRVIHVLVSGRMGGAETVALQINAFLNEQRNGTSSLLVPSSSDVERHVQTAGLAYRKYSLPRLGSRQRLGQLAENLRILWSLRGERNCILHIHNPYVFGAMRPALGTGRFATVLHLHLDYTEKDLEWALARPPDLMILCAGFLRERVEKVLARAKARNTRIAVVRNAVDLRRFSPRDKAAARRELGLASDRPVFLMAANLAEHKGQMTAIRAVGRLRERGFDPLLWLVGEDRDSSGYTDELKRVIDQLCLREHVSLLGYRQDIPALLAAADAFLLPSVREGLPLSILEAQAAKVPVLAAPTAGIPEVISHGETGFLLAAHDDLAYAEMLEKLLAAPDLKAGITEAAYRQVLSTGDLQTYCNSVREAYGVLA